VSGFQSAPFGARFASQPTVVMASNTCGGWGIVANVSFQEGWAAT
jgi:hypothetical protein